MVGSRSYFMHRRDLSRRNKNEPARPYDDAFYIPRQAKAHRRQQCIVSPLQNLPNEILLDIISHLLTVDVLSLCVTSKELQALCNLWGRIFRLDKLINAGREEFAYRCITIVSSRCATSRRTQVYWRSPAPQHQQSFSAAFALTSIQRPLSTQLRLGKPPANANAKARKLRFTSARFSSTLFWN
jgi:hypothetical protein